MPSENMQCTGLSDTDLDQGCHDRGSGGLNPPFLKL